jgi:hypothetical protein
VSQPAAAHGQRRRRFAHRRPGQAARGAAGDCLCAPQRQGTAPRAHRGLLPTACTPDV